MRVLEPIIDIALGFDSAYAAHGASVISSVVRRAPGGKFRFLILHAGISRETQLRVERCVPGHVFVWMEVGDDDLPDFVGSEASSHLTRSTLFRLGLEKLAPADIKRVIYLDADLAVLGDVRQLWRMDLGSYPVAAVADAWIDEAEFGRRWNLPAGGRYFNAGVMVIDVDKVRAERAFSRTIELIAAQGKDMPYHDQDALNRVYWKRWLALDPVWNVQRWMVMQPAQLAADKSHGDREPAIVHYTTGEKPWLSGVWHPWAWLYWDALGHTPFLHEVAAENGVSFLERLRLRLRWLRRRPARHATLAA